MVNRNHRTSVVFPVILVALGSLFLYHSWHPNFDPWPLLWTYWPLILVFIGLARIWDYSQRRQFDPATGAATGPSRSFSVGATVAVLAFAVVLIIVLWHGGG